MKIKKIITGAEKMTEINLDELRRKYKREGVYMDWEAALFMEEETVEKYRRIVKEKVDLVFSTVEAEERSDLYDLVLMIVGGNGTVEGVTDGELGELTMGAAMMLEMMLDTEVVIKSELNWDEV